MFKEYLQINLLQAQNRPCLRDHSAEVLGVTTKILHKMQVRVPNVNTQLWSQTHCDGSETPACEDLPGK